MDLLAKKCVPCEGGVPPIKGEAIKDYLTDLKWDWEIVESEKKIRREFKFKGFGDAISFVNAVADLAENEGHHPDFHIFYSKVIIELWTHAINGLSENDFIMAAKIDNIF
jgi:4a-hydroxytetrahydrobiopterin dehydratase